MRSATVQEIKQELLTLKPAELTALCLRLARFKKENKELLTYLLFEAHHEAGFVRSIKEEIQELFSTVNHKQLYFAKKTLRKIVRVINKYGRYSNEKQSELELRLFFCLQLKESGIPIRQNAIIRNLYEGQIKKINSLLSGLHEDLQYDFRRQVAVVLEE